MHLLKKKVEEIYVIIIVIENGFFIVMIKWRRRWYFIRFVISVIFSFLCSWWVSYMIEEGRKKKKLTLSLVIILFSISKRVCLVFVKRTQVNQVEICLLCFSSTSFTRSNLIFLSPMSRFLSVQSYQSISLTAYT